MLYSVTNVKKVSPVERERDKVIERRQTGGRCGENKKEDKRQVGDGRRGRIRG